MTNAVNICSLDYLIGTIATAYKGMITSLVAKDFCIIDEEGEMTLKGTILSMPEGKYQARLMHEGSELARTGLKDGCFELKTEGEIVKRAKNLQIDVVQNGRHIGTFLLKREKKGEFFFPATELSEELRGMDLKRLTARIHGKIGLMKKAEDIVSKILSPKKDWGKVTEGIHGFASDVFWAERDTFYGSYPILARYCRLACDRLEADKPLANFLSLLELPLEKEDDHGRLRGLAETWLDELKLLSADLAMRPGHSQRVLKAVNEKFPDMDIGFAVKMLVSSLKKKAWKIPSIRKDVLNILETELPETEYQRLADYGEEKKRKLLRDIAGMETQLEAGRHRKVLEETGRLYRTFPDETDVVNNFFAVIGGNLRPETAEKTARALLLTLEGFGGLSPETSRRMASHTVGFIRKLAGKGITGTCAALLRRMGSGDITHGQDLLLDPETARVLLQAGNEDLLQVYKDVLKDIFIPPPGISGFSTDTWAEISNPLHIERLRKFMRIISLDGRHFRDVLVHVICNLHVSGVFIPDDSLFQREISSYLNSGNFGDNFLLNYLLLQRLPVYFNEVGATGKIRQYTTEIDAWGNDTVLYFLRKQIHVNASNYNVRLITRTMECWASGDFSLLRDTAPADVIERLDPELLSRYAASARPFFESAGLLEEGVLRPERLTGLGEEELRSGLEAVEATEEVRTKILLLCLIYKEVVKKYSFAPAGLGEGDIYESLPRYIERMKGLKDVIVSAEKTRPEESLYFKRHIAFGIPSVMGSYHELKFNAMGELLRNGEKVRVVLEKISTDILGKKDNVGSREPDHWISCLSGMNDLFHLFGLGNFQVDEILTILRTNSLYLSQVSDMLRLWRRELTWIVESFHRTFYGPLEAILEAIPQEDLPGRLQGSVPGSNGHASRTVDIILRDILASVVGPVELDNILDGLTGVLDASPEGGDRIFSSRGKLEGGSEFLSLDELPDNEAMKLAALLGTKAKNLAYMHNRGLPVPAGIVFLSRGADNYREYTESENFASTLRRAVRKLEEKSGAFFGGSENPLFLSVRSGSYISMPGILSSILYCGMNPETIDAYIAATGDSWLAWDSYRRFLFHYGTVVHGMDGSVFEYIARNFLAEKGSEKNEDLKAEEMEELSNLYLEELRSRGITVPEDVYEQLREAVKSVYGSWHSRRAGQFRKALKVSERWGTSATLMQMVPGNSRGGGASVFFTRQPSTLKKGAFGDTRERATGDDLVYGGLISRPLAKERAADGQKSLEEADPELFSLHLDLAGRVEEAMRGLPQEVEATYVTLPKGKRFIYVLQTRRMEFHRGFTKRFEDVCRMEESVIGRGAGVHGGPLSGLAIFTSSLDDVREMRADRKVPVILLRKTASTDDVSLMPEVDGILTSAGGATSHASILAQKFDLTAVVGCSDMVIGTDEKGEPFARIGDYTVTEGAVISIDGSTGLVYSGSCVVPDADSPTNPHLA